MSFIEFVSNPSFQSVLVFLTVLLAAFTCWMTYRLTRPKIKVKIYKSKLYSGNYDAIFVNVDHVTCGLMKITFSNNSPNKVQIKNVSCIYRNHLYSIMQSYINYSKHPIKISLKRDDKYSLYEDKLFFNAPITLDSFEEKTGYVIFPEFPITSKKEILVLLAVKIIGKISPVMKALYFTKSDDINLPYEQEFKVNSINVKLKSSIPLRDHKKSTKNKRKK